MIAATVAPAIAPPLLPMPMTTPLVTAPFPPLLDQRARVAPPAQAQPDQLAPTTDLIAGGKAVEAVTLSQPQLDLPQPKAAVEPTDPVVHPPIEQPAEPIAVDAMVAAMMAALPPAPAAVPAATPVVVASSSATATTGAAPVTAATPAPPPPAPLLVQRQPQVAHASKLPVRDDDSDPVASAGVETNQSARTDASPPAAPAPPTQPVNAAPSARPEAIAPPFAREISLDSDGEWLATIARDIARAADPAAPLAFRLRPEALGELRIELTRIEDSTSIRIVTETEGARAALAEGQQRLIAEARSNGVRIAETSVLLADSGTAQHHQDRRQNEPNRPLPLGTHPQRSNAPDLANHDPSQPGDRYA